MYGKDVAEKPSWWNLDEEFVQTGQVKPDDLDAVNETFKNIAKNIAGFAEINPLVADLFFGDHLKYDLGILLQRYGGSNAELRAYVEGLITKYANWGKE